MGEGPLLILGGGRHQLATIRRAREAGLTTLVIDVGPNPVARPEADIFIKCDTTDIPAALEHARDHRVRGVIAPATDVAVLTQALIASELGLTGPSPEAARIFTNKACFRAYCQTEAIAHPSFETLKPDAGMPDALPFSPAILKPATGSGGRGCAKVLTLSNLEAAWPDFLAASPDGEGVLEAWIDGRNLTLEGFLKDGAFAFAMVTERLVPPPPHVGTIGHVFPSGLARVEEETVRQAVRDVCIAAGVHDGPVDADVILSDGGVVYILEVSPRTGGNNLSVLAAATQGIDLTGAAIGYAVGDLPTVQKCLAPQQDAMAGTSLVFHSPTSARLFHDADFDPGGFGGMHGFGVDYTNGAIVPAFRSGRDRLGSMTLTAERREDLPEQVARAYVAMGWALEPLVSGSNHTC